jgi:thiol:disulfide interchange protein DsbD
MQYLTALLLLGFSLQHPLLFAEAQLAASGQGVQPPGVQAWLVGDEVRLDQDGAGTFRIGVEVPPDHHGYLDAGDDGLLIPFAFTFAPLEAQGTRVTVLSRPSGKRDDDVRATVLRGAGEFTFRLDTNGATLAGDRAVPATLRYQICNDLTKICYPPRTTEIPLKVVAASSVENRTDASVQSAPWNGASLTISERITELFRRSMGNLLLALGLVVVAGLLTSATPCVYAVIPVTAALLAARGGGSRRRSRWHTMVYCLGMMSFYSLLGLVAATTGTALSAVMTSAWVNLGFAVLFVYLGLSMLGFYELQVLPALTARLDTTAGRRSGFSGTFLMGITAGLVVSPCVGPVAGAILLEITGQAAQGSGASAGLAASALARGIVLMTGFGLGLSLVFLLVGLLSNRLPQSGKWLTRVKIVLGLPILYFAYTYYLKGLETMSVADSVAHAMLIGIVAIVAAVWIGALHPLGGPPPRHMLLRRAGGIILLIVGVHFLYNGLGHSGILIGVSPTALEAGTATDIATPQPGSSGRAPQLQVQVQGNLSWFRDFAVAKQRAEVVQQPIFVDFYATWCANCKEFERLAIRHTQLNAALQQAVLVKIYDIDPIFPTFQHDPHFPELGGVGGQPFLPLFAIYTPQGQFAWKGQDYRAVHTMIAQLEHARAGKR